jgi:phosphatidylinositol alpha-1,6-mannosyltransferase
VKRLVGVSANLRRDGGGAAALGRLVVAESRVFARSRGLGFSVLHLAAADLDPVADIRHFDGRKAALAAAVARTQASGDAALVFDHLGPARVQAWLPAGWRRPYAVFALGVEVERALTGDRRRALENASLRLAISEHTRRLTERSAGVDAQVLYPALEEEAATGTPDRAALERAGDGFFLIVGRLAASERYKGHERLFEALRRVPNARLVVAGDGDDRARLEAAAHDLGDRVAFLGFVDDATRDALYARCRALVLPSTGEGFGLVYLEAMRAGRACVGLAEGAASEIVVDGESGRLVDATSDALAGALRELLDDARSSKYGAAGRRRYESHFTLERFRAEFVRHLDALLRAVSARRAA